MKQLKYNQTLVPTEKIRNFDGRDYQGLEIELELGDINKFGNQYVQTKKTNAFPFEFGGRTNKILGIHGEIITRKIERLGLVQGGSSGSRDLYVYNSYREYFNRNKKRQLIASWHRANFSGNNVLKASLMLKLNSFSSGINPQVSLTLNDCTIETRYDHNFLYPEEWVSEFFSRFKFKSDCYTSADKAIANLKPEWFATTTVALLTISKSRENARKLRKISGASEVSPLIIHGEQMLMAVRFEDYPAIIYNIYNMGGAVISEAQR
jgi:hypothetical protein